MTRFAPTTAVAAWSVSSDLHAESIGGDGPAVRQRDPNGYSEVVKEGELRGASGGGDETPRSLEPSPLCKHFWRPVSGLPLLSCPIPFRSLYLLACNGREEVTAIR